MGRTPFVEGWHTDKGVAKFHFPHPAALFIAYIKLSVLGGFVMSLPVSALPTLGVHRARLVRAGKALCDSVRGRLVRTLRGRRLLRLARGIPDGL
jgi:hypothetical protein